MSELVPGGNTALPSGAWTFRVPGPFDVSALITDDDGKVRGDADFVFFNQPTAPGARLHGGTLTLDPAGLRTGASRVTLVVSPADPGTQLARLPTPTLQVTDPRGHVLTRFTPAPVRTETVLLLAEVYRRAGVWKVRALGQGYADGLAGLARDFGVDVTDDGAEDHTEAAPASAAPPRPASAPDPDGFLVLVNPARAQAGSPPVVLDPRLTSAARAHAAAMAAARKLGVEGQDGVSVFQRVTAAGFAYLAVGEHLVSGPRTHAEFVEYCLSGGDTRRTVQDPAFTHVGVARADAYWTAVWASPLTPAGLGRVEAEVLELTNRERIRAGLGPLAPDGPLARAARAYCADMATRAFYSHTSPEGTQPWDRAKAAGSVKRSIGENIACGQRSAAEVVEGWMNSPGHRANILKADFTHLGVGFAGGGPSGTYWTQLFGA
ncbi:CAP domain-containing protein [Streptomyces acidiscabies]|uniref:CAP domain-containing protein n=1 Tax=Streptomyces acidiscabies TaxID=42234 RepID=UPI0038F6A2C1